MVSHWRDFSTAVVLFILCAVVFLVSAQFEKVPAAFAQGMQAEVFPRMIAITIAFLAAIMLWQGRGKDEPERAAVRGRVYITGLVLLVSAVMMIPVGVTLTAVFSCFVIPVIWGERNYPRIALFAIALPAILYCVFSVLLKLRLPQGPLQGIL